MFRSKLLFFYLIAAFVAQAQGVQHVDAKVFSELISKNDGVVLDVRTQGEYSRGHIANSTLISTSDRDFVKKVSLLSKDKPIYVYCLTGSRSNAVVNYLSKNGYTQLYNLSRGIIQWQHAGYTLEQSSQVAASTSKVYTPQEFEDILDKNQLVLVDFHAKWCAPCKKMLPVIDKAKSDYDTKLQVVKLDIEANEKLKSKYQVESIPGFVIFQNGVEVWRHTGMVSQLDLYKVLDSYL